MCRNIKYRHEKKARTRLRELAPPAAKGSQEIGLPQPSLRLLSHVCTGCLGKLKAKLCDWAVRPVRVGCYSWAAPSPIDSFRVNFVKFVQYEAK